MQTPQTIVIIGTGKTGQAIASGLAQGRDRVVLCDKDHQNADVIASRLKESHPYYEVESVPCTYEATWEGDIIILSLTSCPDRQEVARRVKPVANQKIVVTIEDGAAELSKLLPYSKIVQAFAGIAEDEFLKSPEEKKKIHCPVISHDVEAAEAVARLVKRIGFRPQIILRPLPETVA
jgi:predicted dinucleotide-binding enzyme